MEAATRPALDNSGRNQTTSVVSQKNEGACVFVGIFMPWIARLFRGLYAKSWGFKKPKVGPIFMLQAQNQALLICLEP